MHFPDIGEHRVHVFLALKGTLLFLPAVILHHEIGDRANTPLPEKPPWLIATRLKTRRTDEKAT